MDPNLKYLFLVSCLVSKEAYRGAYGSTSTTIHKEKSSKYKVRKSGQRENERREIGCKQELVRT